MQTDIQPLEEATARQSKKRVKLLTAVLLGAVSGVFIGILAMSVGLLVMNTLSLVMNTAVLRLPGISMTATTFVFFFTIGSFVSTTYIWHQNRAKNQ